MTVGGDIFNILLTKMAFLPKVDLKDKGRQKIKYMYASGIYWDFSKSKWI